MLATLLPVLALGAFASASPFVMETRNTAAIDLPYNFTLAALNTTLPNANTTGAPLVLASAGAVDGASYQATATWASSAFNFYTPLALVDSSLRVVYANGDWNTNATALTQGGILGWYTTGGVGSPAPTGFSAVEGGAFPVLAWDGVVDEWSLCPSTSGTKQTNLVYNVSADVPPPSYLGFDPAACWGVTVNIVQS